MTKREEVQVDPAVREAADLIVKDNLLKQRKQGAFANAKVKLNLLRTGLNQGEIEGAAAAEVLNTVALRGVNVTKPKM